MKIDFINKLNKRKATVNVELTANAIIYTRVSSKEQVKNNSLFTQRKHCLEFAKTKGFTVIKEFGNTYESAKTDDDRKHFTEMIKFATDKRNRISHLIIYDLDRFSRSELDSSVKILKKLHSANVKIHTPKYTIDNTTPEGNLQAFIQLGYSNYDNEIRTRKCVAGMIEKLKEGKWLTKLPLGLHRNRETKAVEISKQGFLIRRAFELKRSGLKNSEIKDRISALGLTLHKSRWSDIFKNPLYAGIIYHGLLNYEPVESNDIPKITPIHTFQVVNNLLELNNHGYHVHKENKKFPLKVFLKCAECGKTYAGYTTKNNDYYKCNTKGCKCNKRADHLHDLFKVLLRRYELKKGLIPAFKKQMEYSFEELQKETLSQKLAIQKTITEINNKINTISERFALGVIDKDLYQKFENEYKSEMIKAKSELEKVSLTLSNFKNILEYGIKISSNLNKIWETGEYDLKEKLQTLVFPDGIIYNRNIDSYRTPKVNRVFEEIDGFLQKIPCFLDKNESKKEGRTTSKSNSSVLVAGTEPSDL